MPDLSWLDVALRIGVAGALAGSIGLERELRDREAGLRTHLLVGVGAALALWPLRIIEHGVVVAIRPEEGRLEIELPPGASAAPVLEELERHGTRVDQLEIEDGEHRRSIVATVHLRERRLAPEVVSTLSELEGVRRVEWVA